MRLDETKDVGATNRRQLAALYCGATAGYEVHLYLTQFTNHSCFEWLISVCFRLFFMTCISGNSSFCI